MIETKKDITNYDVPLWLLVMRKYHNLPEIVDGKLNPIIRGFLVDHTHFPPDLINSKTSWCAALVSASLEKSGVKSMHSAAAIAYERFGVPCDPYRIGAILVFKRADPSNPKARHVGLSEGIAVPGRVYVRGGNQDNRCSVKDRSIEDVVTARWPS